MKLALYEFLIGSRSFSKKCKEGYFWMKNGEFVHPGDINDSMINDIHGYAIYPNMVASLRSSDRRMEFGEAIVYCSGQVNNGVKGMVPGYGPLLKLQLSSVGYYPSSLRVILIKYGLTDICNYLRYDMWNCQWCDSQVDGKHPLPDLLDPSSNKTHSLPGSRGFVIPFYKF